MKNPGSFSSVFWFAFKSGLCFLWAIPWITAAILCFASVILIPVGILLLSIGCAPYYRLQKNRIAAVARWRDRDFEPDGGGEVPWEL